MALGNNKNEPLRSSLCITNSSAPDQKSSRAVRFSLADVLPEGNQSNIRPATPDLFDNSSVHDGNAWMNDWDEDDEQGNEGTDSEADDPTYEIGMEQMTVKQINRKKQEIRFRPLPDDEIDSFGCEPKQTALRKKMFAQILQQTSDDAVIQKAINAQNCEEMMDVLQQG